MRARRLLAASMTAAVAAAGAIVASTSAAPAQTPADPTPLCQTEAAPPGGTKPGRAPASGLRVATFNVLHTLEDESNRTIDRRVELAVEAVAKVDADVVGAQEVISTANHGSVAERMAQGLAGATGQDWHWCWFQSNPHFPGEPDLQPGGGGGPLSEAMASAAREGDPVFREGLAILSRHPIAEATVRRLPPRSYEAPACVPPDPIGCNAAAVFDSRSVLRARIDAPQGPVDMYTSHIAHGLTPLSDATKLAQTIAALAYIDETAAADAVPDFFVGDFNSVEGSPVHQAVTGAGFVDTFRAANPGADGFTSDQDIRSATATVDNRIDYVFARPGSCAMEVAASKVFADQPSPFEGGSLWPSDHLAVVSTVKCAGGADASSGGGGAQPTSAPAAPVVAGADTARAAGGGRGTLAATGGAGLAGWALITAAGGWLLRRLARPA